MLLDDIKELPVAKWGPLLHPEASKRMKSIAPQARCYVFDRDASFKLGQFIRTCADLIAEQIEFAIEPYPTTYVEVEIDAVIDGIGRAGSQAGKKADWKLGFLSHAGRTNTVVCSRDVADTLAGVYGFSRIAKEWGDNLRSDLLDQQVLHVLGSTYVDLTPEQRRNFAGRFVPMFYGDTSVALLQTKAVMDGHIGEARIYAAALLLLHQKKAIALTEKPAYRTMYRGKSRPFMAHNVVTITLDSPVQIRKAMSSGSGETRRAHEVPAHYAHRHGTRNCEHTWQKRGDEENHWDCTKCGRFRYMRRHHMRGDASKGFVKKSYNVTTEDAK
jgi:hypothetical protein